MKDGGERLWAATGEKFWGSINFIRNTLEGRKLVTIQDRELSQRKGSMDIQAHNIL